MGEIILQKKSKTYELYLILCKVDKNKFKFLKLEK